MLDKTDISDSFLLPSDGGSTLMGPHGDKEEEEGSLKKVKTSADLLLPYLSKYE